MRKFVLPDSRGVTLCVVRVPWMVESMRGVGLVMPIGSRATRSGESSV